ncbi:MAG: lamin tail domain-containing protein [Candidatus Berkelbacteria bacterium]|nr:MAG: lamin tail domain-containing protein [Candidatus Berkelbacteria bacterium]QQG51824.1 MAG: lamin tail domain-containing protein [Candidatus Berkelbacteria bacterium]
MQRLKKLFVRFLVVLLAVQGQAAVWLFSPSAAHAAGTQEVVINEIMWMGSEASAADEWIELRNNSETNTVDLTNWKLTNVSSGGDLVIPAGTIAPGGYFLISNYDKTSASSVLNVTPDYVTTTLQVGNSCLPIVLQDAASTQVDEMGCNVADYFGGTNTATKAALERNAVIEDGALASSWHTGVGNANLDATATNTLATPKFVNDVTVATAGTVMDGGDFTAVPTALSASWSGFADPESGVISYLAGVGTTAGVNNTLALTNVGNVLSYNFDFTGSPLSENETYFINVIAVNGVNLLSNTASSNGITVNTSAPNAPVPLMAIDTPNDNGGSVTVYWQAGGSPDVTSYQVNYRKLGDVGFLNTNAGLNLSAVLTGLLNAPATYEVTIESIDFNNQHSVPTGILQVQALDNLAPILDVNKVVIAQNKPGNSDTIGGNAGASNEAGVTVYVFDRNPAETTKVLINSVMANADGSFSVMGLGDNRYAQVWVQLVDAAGNSSEAKAFTNDTVAPNAPTLNKSVAVCPDRPCRVTLEWTDNGPDTAYYKVSYVAGGVEKLSMEFTSTTAALDLEGCATYGFKVLAFDKYGNESSSSNAFEFRLTPGVKTTVEFVDGKQVTKTEALGGTRQVRRASVPSGFSAEIIPPVQASEPEADKAPLGDDSADGAASDQDWVRIGVVIALLLIIAGSFYALSRSMRDGNGGTSKQVVKDVKTPVAAGTKRPRTKRRGRPARRK